MPLPTYKDAQAKKAERERKKQDRMPKPWWWFKQRDPIARFTLYLGLFTLCLVVVGILQWHSINGQLDEMKSGGKQTASLIADTHTLAMAAASQATATQDTASGISIQAQTAANEERAWIGAQSASLSSIPDIHVPNEIIIKYQNFGKGLAYDFVPEKEIFTATTNEEISDRFFKNWESCAARMDEIQHRINDKVKRNIVDWHNIISGPTIAPSAGNVSYELPIPVSGDWIDADVAKGNKYLVITECFMYRPYGAVQIHSDMFCFSYKKGATASIGELDMCPISC